MRILLSMLLLLPACLVALDPAKPSPTKADEPLAKAFSARKAADFLDGASLAWTRERRCVTCHTNVPYMLARPRIAAGNAIAIEEIRRFLEKRVSHWEREAPNSDYDVFAAAMALAAHDSATTNKLHPATKTALDRSWTLQKEDGSFVWPKCAWPPMEHDDYYGVVFVALAAGMAPEEYKKQEAAAKGLAKIRTWLASHPAPDLHHRAMLLWTSTKIDGILTDENKRLARVTIRDAQAADGSWNLPSLGRYVRRDGSANDPKGPGDGYATGLCAYILRESGVASDDPALKKAVAWLLANQRESGRWFTRSVSNDKAHYITNAGSAYAVLALSACGVKLD